jgi:hypothetical protein
MSFLLLSAVGCGSTHIATSSPISTSQKATVRITYTATSRSSASQPATITYTDPLQQSQASVPGKAGWFYTWTHVAANKPIPLQVLVKGSYPSRDSCAIQINGHQVASQTGQSTAEPGAAVICSYTLTPSNA